MNVIVKINAVFLAPIILSIFFLLFNIIQRLIDDFSLTFAFDTLSFGFLIIYIYALPAYLFIGFPISLIIERMNKGIDWINFSLVGVLLGLILIIINSDSSLQQFDTVVTLFLWGSAGFSYYISFACLEKLVSMLRSKP